jgi:hypothetical protein
MHYNLAADIGTPHESNEDSLFSPRKGKEHYSSNLEPDYGSQHLENPHSTGAETEDPTHTNQLGSWQIYEN